MDIAFMVEPQVGGSYDELVTLARWADEMGLVAFARSDHYLNGDTSEPATDALASFGS